MIHKEVGRMAVVKLSRSGCYLVRPGLGKLPHTWQPAHLEGAAASLAATSRRPCCLSCGTAPALAECHPAPVPADAMPGHSLQAAKQGRVIRSLAYSLCTGVSNASHELVPRNESGMAYVRPAMTHTVWRHHRKQVKWSRFLMFCCYNLRDCNWTKPFPRLWLAPQKGLSWREQHVLRLYCTMRILPDADRALSATWLPRQRYLHHVLAPTLLSCRTRCLKSGFCC